MSESNLLTAQLKDISYQLEKCLEGLTSADGEYRVAPTAFSITEIVNHLSETYTAVKTVGEGGKHEWGSYQPVSTDLPVAVAELWRLRALALDSLNALDAEKRTAIASDYIVLHDAYHVGQLVLSRLALQPEWDSFSIYNHG